VKVIRPGHLDDLDELVDLFERNRERLTGISSLRANRDLLAKKLEASVSTFADEIDDPADQEYFFVLEDSANGALAGTCAIWPSIGLRTPFYSYKVGTVVHSSARLGIFADIRGRGLWIGCELTAERRGQSKDFATAAFANGVMCLRAGPDVVRFAPALNIDLEELTEGVRRFGEAARSLV